MDPKASQFPDVSEQIAEVAYLNDWHRPPAFVRFLQEIISAVYRFVLEIVHDFKLSAMAIGRSGTTAALVEVLMAVVLFLLLLAFIYMIWPKIVDGRKALKQKIAKNDSIKIIEGSHNLKEKALKLVLANDFDLAVKCLYLSALQLLNEKGMVSYLAVATNFEYCNLLGNNAEIKRTFRQIADLEEKVSFGQTEASRQDFDRCLGQLNDLGDKLNQWAERKKTEENLRVVG